MGASLHHIFREANSVADALASLQLGRQQYYISGAALPIRPRGKALLDRHGVPRIREVLTKA